MTQFKVMSLLLCMGPISNFQDKLLWVQKLNKFNVFWNLKSQKGSLAVNVWIIQGGSIKPLLRFGGRFFRIGIKLGTYLNRLIIYVILSISGENSIANKACVAEIRIFPQNTQ